jgi:hypothetical protein
MCDRLETLVLAYARYTLATALVEDISRQVRKQYRRHQLADLFKHEAAKAEALRELKSLRGIFKRARDEWQAAAAALNFAEQAVLTAPKARAA